MRGWRPCNLRRWEARWWTSLRASSRSGNETLLQQARFLQCALNRGARRNARLIRLEHRPSLKIDFQRPGPAQDGEQIRIRHRKRIPHEEGLVFQEAGQPVEFLLEAGLRGSPPVRRYLRIEQRAESLVHFRSDVVQYFHQLIAFEGAGTRCQSGVGLLVREVLN